MTLGGPLRENARGILVGLTVGAVGSGITLRRFLQV